LAPDEARIDVRIPKRKLACVLCLLLLPVACGDGGGGNRSSAPDASRPVILIGLDTLRGDHLHCAGLDWIETPHLDALAAAGVLFTDCLATAPWTGSSFASIFTGLLPYRHGFLGGKYGRLADEYDTLAELFQEAGYATAAYVTINWLTHDHGMAQGFAEGEKFDDGGRGEEAPLVTRRGLDFMRRNRNRPFFLFLHYFDVHAPYTPPPPFDRMYYDGDLRAPGEPLTDFLLSPANPVLRNPATYQHRAERYRWLEGVTDWLYPVRQYAAGVSFVDSHVGRVLAGLQELGLYDEALIVVVSDHGEHLREHGFHFTHALPYQEAIHVPLIMKWPHQQHAGSVVDDPVSTLDILPTILEVLGRPVPEGLDGRDVAPLVRGAGPAGSSLQIAEQGSHPQLYSKALVQQPWKLLLFCIEGRLYPTLYNLVDDPGELQDVAAGFPEVTSDLLERLWTVCDRGSPLTRAEPLPPRQRDPETVRKLRALGYVD